MLSETEWELVELSISQQAKKRKHPEEKGKDRLVWDSKIVVGGKGLEESKFSSPSCISYVDNLLYVLDTGNQRVQIFNSIGSFSKSIPLKSPMQSKYNSLFVDKDTKDIYVTDPTTNCILVFNQAGERVSVLTEIENQDSYLESPGGIFFQSKSATMVVTDKAGHCVMILDAKGRILRLFGSEGSGKSEFNQPTGVFVNSWGQILVADTNNSRVQVFSQEGFYAFQFGNNLLLKPVGLYVDQQDCVYVADVGREKVFVFDPFGRLLYHINANLAFPISVAFDEKEERIIVCEQVTNRVQFF